jgi:hypothetical protein
MSLEHKHFTVTRLLKNVIILAMVKSNGPVVIGRHTSISFPSFGIKKVPAKVDTGADSSSLWASDVAEVNGLLSYKLFAPSSIFFTGQEIKTKQYQKSYIKNSFGHTEQRYKVKVPIQVEGRHINASFTLADRSLNTFPVLIGRRTLQGKFLVDVSKAQPQRRPAQPKIIDILAVTGTKGKTTVVRLLGDILSVSHSPVLRVDTSGAYINGELRMGQERSKAIHGLVPTVSPGRMLTLLNDFPLDSAVAVLECSLGCSTSVGLGYRRHKVGIFTNVLEDHLGSKKSLSTKEGLADAAANG